MFQASLATAHAMGWAVVAAVPAEGRIEAIATTRLLRFKDDVVLRLRADGDGARLDMRSASRIGRCDLGANEKRIRAFFVKLNSCLKTNSYMV